MFRKLSLGLLGLSVLTLSFGCGSTSSESVDREAIQGTWQGVSVKGLDLEGLDEGARFEFTKERFRMDLIERITGTYTLDPSRQPKAIDLLDGFEPDSPVIFRGIYELDGDRLRLCLRFEEGTQRPGRFAATPDSPDLLIELRRVLAGVAESVQEEPLHRQSRDNLQRIGVAMHKHHDVHRCFPAAVVTGPDGKTPHSWRVALLPFLGEAEKTLYDQYRLDQPWDSPQNRQLLAKIPAVFRAPGDGDDSTNASVFALVGPDTVFSSEQGTRLAQVTDGSSNTLMLVETRRQIPWTQPEDIAYDPNEPIPELGGLHAGGFYALFCDGAVRAIPKNTDDQTLRSLISKRGGEPTEGLPDRF